MLSDAVVFDSNALKPIPVLLLPVVLFSSACKPSAELAVPLVFNSSASYPTAVLLEAVFVYNAFRPIATLDSPTELL